MSGSSTPATRRYRGRSAADRRAERREQLMQAGLDLFGTDGYSGTSIERLCSTAGVSTRNFYEEFSSREALLIALHDRMISSVLKEMTDMLAELEDASLQTRIEQAVRTFVSTTSQDSRWARVNFVELIGVSPTVEQHRMAWRQQWIAFIVGEAERGVRRGEAKPGDYTMAAISIIGAVNELVNHHSHNPEKYTLEMVIEEVRRLAETLTVVEPNRAAGARPA